MISAESLLKEVETKLRVKQSATVVTAMPVVMGVRAKSSKGITESNVDHWLVLPGLVRMAVWLCEQLTSGQRAADDGCVGWPWACVVDERTITDRHRARRAAEASPNIVWGAVPPARSDGVTTPSPPENLVDPASSHMLRSRAKPCMSQRKWNLQWVCEWLLTSAVIQVIECD